MERTVYNADKMYTYIRGYASGVGMIQTLKALSLPGKSIMDRNVKMAIRILCILLLWLVMR